MIPLLKELALFEGNELAYNNLKIEREGGDFGISVKVENDQLNGRLVGREGGAVRITIPSGLLEKK